MLLKNFIKIYDKNNSKIIFEIIKILKLCIIDFYVKIYILVSLDIK